MSFQDDGVVCSLKHYVRERAHLLPLLAALLGLFPMQMLLSLAMHSSWL